MDVVPLAEPTSLYPFTGFVVNLNCATKGHRDFGDKEICIVFQFSDCEGGELVLVEPGVVVRLRSGDGIIFPSAKITHLNTPFTGKRASVVFHSDSSFDSWLKDRNEWAHHNSCSTFSSGDLGL